MTRFPGDGTAGGSRSGGFSNPVNVFKMIFAVVALVVAIWGFNNTFEQLDAKQVMLIQYPNGDLGFYNTPGIKPQWFGRVHKFDKRAQFWFSAKGDQGAKMDQSIKVRFNDGGHANVSGSLSWEMPVSRDQVIALYSKYGSEEAIQQQLIRTAVEKSVYMTGPLMSSKESYAERRNDLLTLIEDQLQRGVYRTRTFSEKQPDPITGELKTVTIVQIVQDDHGNPLRQEVSSLQAFGVPTYNLSINEVKYDDVVEKQIRGQQDLVMQVQTAIADARRAEQAAITAEKNGQAEAAKAKWAQEVVKATEVTAAQKRLAVAELDAKAAVQTKLQQTLLGEGEGARKRAVMLADGGLATKVDAYVKVSGMYADAIKGYAGNWVPGVVFGGDAAHAAPGSGAQQLINMLSAKTAMDLGINMSVPGAAATAGGGKKE